MTTAPVAAERPPFAPGRIARAIAAFSGVPGQVIKLTLLALTNGLAVWAAYVLADRRHWVALPILIVATALIDVVYLTPRSWTLPAKFILPGTIFLVAFQIVPIIYTIEVAFSNYSTGHVAAKDEAISAIQVNSLQPPANGRQFQMAPARDSSGHLVLILHDDASGKVYVGTTKGLTPLAKSDVTVSDSGQPTAAEGYTLI
jgi:arabinogalactan oligomer/maltooligosaccharide transport system permease protein